MKAEYKRDLQSNYLILEAGEGGGEEDYRVRMAEQNRIPGLLPFRRTRTDGIWHLHYEITGLQPISSLYEKKLLSGADILSLLTGVSEVLDILQKYLLSPEQVLLSPDFIYAEPERKRLHFCYAPGIGNDAPISLLAEFMLKQLDHQDNEAVALGYLFYQKTQEENFSLQKSLKQILKEQQGTAAECREGLAEPWAGNSAMSAGQGMPAAGGGNQSRNAAWTENAAAGRDVSWGFGGKQCRDASGNSGGKQGRDASWGYGGKQGRDASGDSGGKQGRDTAGGSDAKPGRNTVKPGNGMADRAVGQGGIYTDSYGGGAWETDVQRGNKAYEGMGNVGNVPPGRVGRGSVRKASQPSGRAAAQDGTEPEEVIHKKRRKTPRIVDRIFQAVHPAVLLLELFGMAVLEIVYYLGYLRLSEAGGAFFLILAVGMLANSQWRKRREEKEAQRYGRWAEEDQEEGEDYIRLQEELYSPVPEKTYVEETRCLSEFEVRTGIRLLLVRMPENPVPSLELYQEICLEKGTLVIGKIKGQCDVLLHAATVSRVHARLECRGGRYFLKDLNSRNGTFLNGQRLQPQEEREFHAGDQIAFAEIGYRAVQ